jgi:hypothetical protein
MFIQGVSVISTEGIFYDLNRSKIFRYTWRVTHFRTGLWGFGYKMLSSEAVKEVLNLSYYVHYKICWNWSPWHPTHAFAQHIIDWRVFVNTRRVPGLLTSIYYSLPHVLCRIPFSGVLHIRCVTPWIKNNRSEIWRPRWPWNGTTDSCPALWVRCSWGILLVSKVVRWLSIKLYPHTLPKKNWNILHQRWKILL